jgi:hypothetical protein
VCAELMMHAVQAQHPDWHYSKRVLCRGLDATGLSDLSENFSIKNKTKNI